MPERIILIAMGLMLLLPACSGCNGEKEFVKPELTDEPEKNTVKLYMGGIETTLELAITNEARGLGLMHRKKLPRDRGMIFINPQPKPMSFYMRNTTIPLSIAFIRSDGTIINIEKMQPLVHEPSYLSKGFCRFAIEMNQGWFEERGIREGDKIELTEEILTMKAEPSL